MPEQSQHENVNEAENAAAQKALLEVIATAAEGVAASRSHKPHEQVTRIRELALAYRLVTGGPQPGSIE